MDLTPGSIKVARTERWRDGFMVVINGTSLSLREGVHDAVFLHPLDLDGELVE
jgi:hypothetical protein